MSNTWKFNGREIEPDKLLTRDDVLSRLLTSGGTNADHGVLMDWD